VRVDGSGQGRSQAGMTKYRAKGQEKTSFASIADEAGKKRNVFRLISILADRL
jgi:hypothetical protein